MFDRLALARGAGAPASIAMSWLEGEATFGQLAQDVGRVSSALFQLRTLMPSVVAIRYEHPYRHWILVLALARLGLPSASLPGHVDANFHRAVDILTPDIVLLDQPTEGNFSQSLVLDENWFEHVCSIGKELDEIIPVLPDDVLRLSLAGGTGHTTKRIALTARYVETAIYHLVFQDLFSQKYREGDLRVLPTLGAETSSGFLVILAALAAGTRLQMLTAAQLGLVFSQKTPTVAVVSPLQIEAILSQLPPGMAPLPELYLTIAGGKLPSTLRDSICQMLTPNVQVVYGADECGVVTVAHSDPQISDDVVGQVLPWVGLQIVDEQGSPVPAGSTGTVRVCGTGVVDGYHNDPDATAAQFKNGWFYPGDRGFLDLEGNLHLVGRTDDLVSFGGDKFDLDALDARLLGCAGVKDGAMFVVPDRQGVAAPWVALVTDVDFKLEELSTWMREIFPNLPDVTAVWISAVPRLESGQPDRVALWKAVQSS